MKQNDVVLILVCVFIAGVLSFVVSNQLFGGSQRKLQAESVEPISSEFIEPDSRYFNDKSFNYTQQIQIGSGSNNVQFGE